MEDSSSEYTGRLQSAIQDKRSFIVTEAIPIIENSASEFKKTLETLLGTLLNAGILKEDKFGGGSDPHELKLPPDDPFSEETGSEELSFRLTEYLRMLEFFENSDILNIDSLSLERIDEIFKFFSFINWERLSPNSVSPNERYIAELELAIQKSDDNLLRGIVRDNRKKLAETSLSIRSGLEDIQVFLRESYKLEIRNRVLPAIAVDPEFAAAKPDDMLLHIRKEFRAEMSGHPFHPDLVQQIINEDYSAESENFRTECLQRIMLNKTAEPQLEDDFGFEDEEESDSSLLLEGFRLLSAAGPSLLQIADKLIQNSDIIENARISLFRRIILFLTGRKRNKPNRIYNIIIFNAEDETGSRLKLDLERFTSELKKEANYILGAGSENGSIRLELEGSGETSILEELEKHLKRIFRFQSIMPALDKYMKDRADNSMRGVMNGIKLDLNDIQSCLMKANKRRLEYKAQTAL